MVDLFDLPAFGFGVVPGSLLVMLRAFPFGLVFRRDSNPDADLLCLLDRLASA